MNPEFLMLAMLAVFFIAFILPEIVNNFREAADSKEILRAIAEIVLEDETSARQATKLAIVIWVNNKRRGDGKEAFSNSHIDALLKQLANQGDVEIVAGAQYNDEYTLTRQGVARIC
ncbi:MAG: hypothetical protein OXR68_04415 [Alphaproteobacteria bacterium]|nr:hypothetical protein [Alphaproteobacteria bacterium]